MNRLLPTLATICGLVAACPAAHAATITLDLSTAVFTGGAGTIAGGERIKFDPNQAGETATFTLASIPRAQYVISVTGQTNQSSSFLNFFIDADGPGTGVGFVQLGGGINFGSGFNTITLPAFTNLGTRISSGSSTAAPATVRPRFLTSQLLPWQFPDLLLARASPRFSA